LPKFGDQSIWESLRSKSNLTTPLQSKFGDYSMWRWFKTTTSTFGDLSMWEWFKVPQLTILEVPKSSGKLSNIILSLGSIFLTTFMFGILYTRKMVPTISTAPIIDIPELPTKQVTNKVQTYFKFHFTNLDFDQVVTNSLATFLTFCNQQIHNVFPNHKCINATTSEGGTIIEFQGDNALQDDMEKFVSGWKTEDILNDPLFTIRNSSPADTVTPAMTPKADVPPVEKHDSSAKSYALVVTLASVTILF